MVGGIGKRLTGGLLLALILAVGIVGAAIADGGVRISCPLTAGDDSDTCPPIPRLRFELDGQVTPMSLPRNEMQPAALDLHGRVQTTDATHPSALREMTIELDRNVSIDSTGVPVCRGWGGRELRGEGPRDCGSAIAGRGRADFEIAFPEQGPVKDESPVTIYNEGLDHGVQKLNAYAFVTVPVPAEIITTVEIKRVPQERYGSQAVVKVPVIAGGSGSLLRFDLRLKRLFELRGVRRSVVKARCPDGRLSMKADPILFKNEAHTPGVPATTVMRGLLSIPCTHTR